MGRPKGSTKHTAAKESRARQATTKINESAKPGKIEAPEDEQEFVCICCGKRYKRQKQNFLTSLSPLFAANNGRLPWCRHCIDTYFSQLIDYFSGNEAKAMERVCQIADWYYLDDIFAATGKRPTDTSRVTMYPSKMQLPQWKDGEGVGHGRSYLDTLRDRASAVIQDYDDFDELQEQGETGITKRQLKTWGLGFEEAEYKMLDEHYKSLKDVVDTTDVMQDTLARDLCEIKIQQVRARNKNDADTYQKFVKLYQDTLKTVNIQARRTESDALNDDQACWGNFIRDVERYCPAEYYKDKSLYKDADSFKEYLERFVWRPVRNFMLGTRKMDEEFCIDEDALNDGDAE